VTASQSALLCRDLVHRFGETVAVDHLDLTIAPGEVFGLLGPNGAGTPRSAAGSVTCRSSSRSRLRSPAART
jgi:ABC-type branched-subunit amino acid transport system ATPase component